MRDAGRVARIWCRCAITAAWVLVGALLFAPGAVADAPPAPPQPSAAATAAPALSVGLRLGQISVNLDLLPLNLSQLLTIGSTPASPSAPSSSSSGATSLPVPPPPPAHARSGGPPATTAAPSGRQTSGPATQAGAQLAAPRPSTSAPASGSPRRPAGTGTAAHRTSAAPGSIALSGPGLSDTAWSPLLLVLGGTALAAALMIGFGARRGARQP